MDIRQKSLLAGAMLGAVLGALGGWLFSRGLEMPRAEKPSEKRSVPPGELARLGLSIMTVLRSVADLGEKV